MIKVFSFQSSYKNYTVYRKETVLEGKTLKSEDLINWLQSSFLYPKIFWKSKTKDFSSACLGSLIECDTIPSSFPQSLNLYGAFPFSKKTWKDFSIGLTIPKYELIQKGNAFIYATNSLDLQEDSKPFKEPRPFCMVLPKIQLVRHLPSFKEWEKNIQIALTQFQTKAFDKVVLARRSSYKSESELHPLSLLTLLLKKIKNSYLFLFQKNKHQSFISASPEMLFSLKANHIISEAVAGTRKIQQKMDLLHNTKENLEFSFVKKYIFELLENLCKSVSQSRTTQLLQTTDLSHLHAQFSGILKQQLDPNDLLHTFHPTPAIGGWPKKRALKFIDLYEPFYRGYYSSPFFHLSGDSMETAVGIRSCYFDKNIIHFFAGAGIVQGSDPISEWNELNHKMALIQEIFNGS